MPPPASSSMDTAGGVTAIYAGRAARADAEAAALGARSRRISYLRLLAAASASARAARPA